MQEAQQNTPAPSNKNSKLPPSFITLALLVAFVSAISVIIIHDKNQILEDELTKLRFALNESKQKNALYEAEIEYNKKIWALENSHLAKNLSQCKSKDINTANMQQEVFDMKLEYLKLDKKMEICEVRLQDNLREMQALTTVASTAKT
jgi:hypothetical protein